MCEMNKQLEKEFYITHHYRYLKGTSWYEHIHFKTGKNLEGFIDADGASCINDRRSYTGYVFLLAGAAILLGS